MVTHTHNNTKMDLIEIWYEVIGWTYRAQYRIKLKTIVNTAMNLQFQSVTTFLAQHSAYKLIKRARLHEVPVLRACNLNFRNKLTAQNFVINEISLFPGSVSAPIC